MPDPETDLLIEYVDEHTPEEARPFEYVERALRRRRYRSRLVAVAAVVGVIGGAATVTSLRRQRADEVRPCHRPSRLDAGAGFAGCRPRRNSSSRHDVADLDREIQVQGYADPATPTG